VVVPVVYSVLDQFSAWARRRLFGSVQTVKRSNYISP
jgi:hypothetical protein